MPDGQHWTSIDLVVLTLSLGIIATPSALGGIVTTLALTRRHAPVGRLYAAGLLGAAIGCLAAVALLDAMNLSAAAIAATAVPSLGALAFGRAAGLCLGLAVPVTLALALVAMGGNVCGEAVRMMYPKVRLAWNKPMLCSLWNSHGTSSRSFPRWVRRSTGAAATAPRSSPTPKRSWSWTVKPARQ